MRVRAVLAPRVVAPIVEGKNTFVAALPGVNAGAMWRGQAVRILPHVRTVLGFHRIPVGD
nr:hypothetical protein [Hymenobacter qilianensis]